MPASISIIRASRAVCQSASLSRASSVSKSGCHSPSAMSSWSSGRSAISSGRRASFAVNASQAAMKAGMAYGKGSVNSFTAIQSISESPALAARRASYARCPPFSAATRSAIACERSGLTCRTQ